MRQSVFNKDAHSGLLSTKHDCAQTSSQACLSSLTPSECTVLLRFFRLGTQSKARRATARLACKGSEGERAYSVQHTRWLIQALCRKGFLVDSGLRSVGSRVFRPTPQGEGYAALVTGGRT